MPRPAVASRESLLEVAIRLFREHGIRGTAVADVIAAAGCGKQAFYRVFATKDELVAAYLEDRVAMRDSATARALHAAGPSPSAQLVAFIAEVAAWTRQPGFAGCAVRNYLREYPDDENPARRVADAYLSSSYDRVLRLAAAARPDEAEALATKVWLIHEGLFASYGSAPEAASAGVELVSILVTTPRG